MAPKCLPREDFYWRMEAILARWPFCQHQWLIRVAAGDEHRLDGRRSIAVTTEPRLHIWQSAVIENQQSKRLVCKGNSSWLEMHVTAEFLQQATVLHRCRVLAEPRRKHDHLTHGTPHHITGHHVRKYSLHRRTTATSLRSDCRLNT